MTQSSLQTRCPKCQTRFRVTQEQLGIANGKVRCGNCMDVFNAIEHEVGKDSPAKPAAPAPPKEPPARDDTPSSSSHDELIFADNPEEDAAEGRYAGSRLTFSDDELSDSFRSMDEKASPDSLSAERDKSDNQVDESWAEAMLSEDTEPSREPVRKTEPEPRTESEPKTDQPPRRREADLPPEDEPLAAERPETGTEFQEQAEPASFPFKDLQRDPVSVSGRSGGGRTRSIVWALVVLALVGVLIAQVTWLQFDRLSAIPELRSFYEKGCELAGCELEPLVDVSAIQSRKLVVRTNPDNRNQLIVDAVIINRAAFEQPFPAIALTFSNLNGDVVAQSVFTPEEYLAGEAREMEAMPTDTPVRIAINIRDPGRDAVNYNIAFRAHTP